MPDPSLVSLFVGPLNRAEVEYMVTGGLAAVVNGHPRLTLDIDLVVRLTAADVARLATLRPDDDFYVPPLEVMEEESRRPMHGHFNIIHTDTAMRADVWRAGTVRAAQSGHYWKAALFCTRRFRSPPAGHRPNAGNKW